MRLIYAGTPAFAVPALEALIAAGHDIALVLTQPDRPAGRGMKAGTSAIKQAAQAQSLPVYQPASLGAPEVHSRVQEARADVMVVAAYGLILPQAVLDLPKLGALNIHASLLPRWRGAAPIQRAILAGDCETGVCIMCMDAGLDTGPVILREAMPIADDETGGSLQHKLALLGARLIGPGLAAHAQGQVVPQPQGSEGISYAAKIQKAESLVDWHEPALQIERRIRAFNPSPGVRARIQGTELKLWAAQATTGALEVPPGSIVAVEEEGVAVACGKGLLWLRQLQRPGAKRLAAKDFLRGFPLEPGQRFELVHG